LSFPTPPLPEPGTAPLDPRGVVRVPGAGRRGRVPGAGCRAAWGGAGAAWWGPARPCRVGRGDGPLLRGGAEWSVLWGGGACPVWGGGVGCRAAGAWCRVVGRFRGRGACPRLAGVRARVPSGAGWVVCSVLRVGLRVSCRGRGPWARCWVAGRCSWAPCCLLLAGARRAPGFAGRAAPVGWGTGDGSAPPGRGACSVLRSGVVCPVPDGGALSLGPALLAVAGAGACPLRSPGSAHAGWRAACPVPDRWAVCPVPPGGVWATGVRGPGASVVCGRRWPTGCRGPRGRRGYGVTTTR